MVEVKKDPFLEWGIFLYQKLLMTRFFSSINMRVNLEVYQDEGMSTIYYGNHSSRWDHIFGMYVTRTIWKKESFLMINTAMMNNYGFLNRAGCFSVDATDPVDVARSMKYTKGLLTEVPDRAVWLFPQGAMLPNDRRPLGCQPGLAQLIRSMDKIRVVPVAFRYEFGVNTKPQGYVSFGKPIIFTRDMKFNTRTLTQTLEQNLTEELEQLRLDIASGEARDFVTIFRSKGLFLTRLYSRAHHIDWTVFQKNRLPLHKWVSPDLNNLPLKKEKSKEKTKKS